MAKRIFSTNLAITSTGNNSDLSLRSALYSVLNVTDKGDIISKRFKVVHTLYDPTTGDFHDLFADTFDDFRTAQKSFWRYHSHFQSVFDCSYNDLKDSSVTHLKSF